MFIQQIELVHRTWRSRGWQRLRSTAWSSRCWSSVALTPCPERESSTTETLLSYGSSMSWRCWPWSRSLTPHLRLWVNRFVQGCSNGKLYEYVKRISVRHGNETSNFKWMSRYLHLQTDPRVCWHCCCIFASRLRSARGYESRWSSWSAREKKSNWREPESLTASLSAWRRVSNNVPSYCRQVSEGSACRHQQTVSIHLFLF